MRDAHGAMARLVAGPSLVALLTAAAAARPADDDATPAASAAIARMTADLSYLADDAQEGRAPGTPGIERSAQYIAETFRQAGLTTAPGLDGYFQEFTITGSPRLGRKQDLVARPTDAEGEAIDGHLRRDFMPLSIGGGATFEGLPVVFAGYGITTADDAGFAYDDYEGVDADGKVVVVLRHAPGYSEEGGAFALKDGRPPQVATFQHKAVNAYRHGARAVLFVNDEAGLEGEEDDLLQFVSAGSERYTTIPFVMVSRAFADRLLDAADAPGLSELEEKITDGEMPEPASFVLEGIALDGLIDVEQPDIVARNVVGVLEGSGPLAEETVVVGAHYDHLGRGGMGSLAPFSRDIHNGADDNASGTTMLMELARRLAARPDPLPRRVVFIAFSGEERGLLGSRYYVDEAPLYPLEQTVAMFNFDMVGRLGDNGKLTVFGVDSTPGLKELVTALGPSYGLEIVPNAQIAGNSDHASFHDKEIPVVFFFTGTHRDYHRPSDDVDLINFEGMGRIADLAELLLLDFVRRTDRPQFVAGEEPEPQGAVSGISVSLGTIPDYDESVEGVRLNGVRENSAAEKAGMKGGDVIVGYGGKPVGTIYDFMEGLSRSKAGDHVEIVVRRGDEEVTLEAVLDPAPTRSPHDE